MIFTHFKPLFMKNLFFFALLFAISPFAAAQQGQDAPKDDKVFTFVERKPEFPGGEKALMEYLGNNIKYPRLAVEAGVEGRVYLSFVVDKAGNVENIKILRGIGYGCDEESLRVIKGMPKWTPGVQNDKAVKVQYTLPVVFKLDREVVRYKPILMAAADGKDSIYVTEATEPKWEGKTDEETTDALSKMINKKKLGKDKKIQTTVYISLLVNKDGSVASVELPSKNSSKKIAEEALRIAKTVQKLEPGRYNGHAVRTIKIITIRFGENQ
jgi:TonB family protein